MREGDNQDSFAKVEEGMVLTNGRGKAAWILFVGEVCCSAIIFAVDCGVCTGRRRGGRMVSCGERRGGGWSSTRGEEAKKPRAWKKKETKQRKMTDKGEDVRCAFAARSMRVDEECVQRARRLRWMFLDVSG